MSMNKQKLLNSITAYLFSPPAWAPWAELGLALLLWGLGCLSKGAAATAIFIFGWLAAAVGVPRDVKQELSFRRAPPMQTLLPPIITLTAFFAGLGGQGLLALILFRAGGLLLKLYIDNTTRKVAKASSRLPQEGYVFRNGQVMTVNPHEICVGEPVIIREGQVVSADGVVVKVERALDMSPLTGDEKAMHVGPGGKVWAGARNGNGLLAIKAERGGPDTLCEHWNRAVSNVSAATNSLDKRLDRLATLLPPAVLLFIAGGAIGLALHGFRFMDIFSRALPVLLLGSALSFLSPIAFSLTRSVWAAAGKGAILKSGDAFLSLSRPRMAVLDREGVQTPGFFDHRTHNGGRR